MTISGSGKGTSWEEDREDDTVLGGSQHDTQFRTHSLPDVNGLVCSMRTRQPSGDSHIFETSGHLEVQLGILQLASPSAMSPAFCSLLSAIMSLALKIVCFYNLGGVTLKLSVIS